MQWISSRLIAVLVCGSQGTTPVSPEVPTQLLDAVLGVSGDYACRVTTRTLTLTEGDPRLDSPEAEVLRAFADWRANGMLSTRGDVAREALLSLCDRNAEVWDGSGLRERRGRVVRSELVRLAQWTVPDSPYSTAVLKSDSVDLIFQDHGPEVGPQVQALAPSLQLYVPDLDLAMQPLRLTEQGIAALADYSWTSDEPQQGGPVAWIGLHPAAPSSPLRVEVDPQSGALLAAVLQVPHERELRAMACVIEHAELSETPGRMWISNVLSLQCSGGGLQASLTEVEQVSFSPRDIALRIDVPAEAHLYDERQGEPVYYGHLSDWPADIAQWLDRPAAEIAGEVQAAALPPKGKTRSWRQARWRYGWAVLACVGILMLAVQQRRRVA